MFMLVNVVTLKLCNINTDKKSFSIQAWKSQQISQKSKESDGATATTTQAGEDDKPLIKEQPSAPDPENKEDTDEQKPEAQKNEDEVIKRISQM